VPLKLVRHCLKASHAALGDEHLPKSVGGLEKFEGVIVKKGQIKSVKG